jgi:PAS domain S-box-containing protein
LFLFVILALGLTTTGYFHHQQHRDYVLGQKEQEILAIANLKLGQILNYREERLGDAEALFSNPLVVRPIREWLREGKEGRQREEILGYLESIRKAEEFDSVFLLDELGKTRLSVTYGEAEAGDQAKTLVQGALQGRKVIVRDLYRDEKRNRIFFDLYVPLLGKTWDGLPSGVLLLRSEPNQFLYPVLRSWPTPSVTAEILLVRREGEEVLVLNELRHAKNTALSLRVPSSRRDNPAAMAVAGIEGVAKGVDYRGVQVLAAIRAVPNSPWYLIAKMDMDEAIYPVREQGYSVLIAGILLVFVLGLTVAFLWRHQRAQLYKRMYEEEIKIQALTKHLALMTKYANDIILLYDDQFRIVEANERATLTYGYTREKFLGLTARDLRPPETWADLNAQIEQIKERKGLVFETIHRRKDGSTFPVEVSVRGLEVEGKQYFQSIIRDITERKEAEERLRKSEERFRDLFDNAPIGYHEYDSEGRITNVNQTDVEMLGYTREEMIGQYIWKFNVGEEIAREQVLAKLAGKLPPGRELERTYRRKDGTTFPVLIEDRLIRDEKGQIKGIRCIIQYITQRKNAEAEREKLIQELQEALAKVKTLRGLIPICASCKKIRDDQGYWKQIESYVRDHSEAEFSHGICPECMKKLYPDFVDDEEGKNDEIRRP